MKSPNLDSVSLVFLVSVLTLTLSACDGPDKAEQNLNGDKPGTIDTLDSQSQTKSPTKSKNSPPKGSFETVEWTDLMPQADLDALLNPPEYLAEIEDGSEADQLSSQLKAGNSVAENRYQQALISKDIRPEFNGRNIRIPGFIVPLEFDDQQTITTFFLVPFFGACLHQPPPPPNQIIYAEYEPGFRLEALYDPFWINGELSTTLVENDMATAAYSITVSTIEPYMDQGYYEGEESLDDST